MSEITQEFNQSEAVGLGFPPLEDSDPMLPKCGEWPQCNRTGKSNRRQARSKVLVLRKM
jgi:hypothetical protein